MSGPSPSPSSPAPRKANFFSKLSLRGQVLLFGLLFLGGLGIWTAVKRKNPDTSARASGSPKSSPQVSDPKAGDQPPPSNRLPNEQGRVSVDPIQIGPSVPTQRLPQPTPTPDEQVAMNRQKAMGLDGPADRASRSVGTPVTAILSRKSGDEESDGEYAQSTKRPAGAPYSAKAAKGSPHEIFGVIGPPSPQTRGQSAPAGAAASVHATAAGVGAPIPPVSSAPETFAPFGRLVKCVLVNTIDSLTPTNTPIIALTTEAVAWNDTTIIPVNTEVFSYVNSDPKMDARGVGRLFDNGEWTLVLPKHLGGVNGREWVVRGRALDRRELIVEPQGRVRTWGLDDMAPGFIGYTVNTLNQEEIKLFIAAFLGAASKAIGETLQTREPVPGLSGALGATQPQPTARNAGAKAAGQGVGAVMDAAADRITEEIKRRGFYVRVPASKEFYLFIEQTLDPTDARVGIRLPTSGGSNQQPAPAPKK